MVAINLALRPLDTSSIPDSTKGHRAGPARQVRPDPVDAVLADIQEYGAQRLVIGIKRRTPVGKALLGSVSQRLLLEPPVPVLAVKLGEDR